MLFRTQNLLDFYAFIKRIEVFLKNEEWSL